MSDNHADLPWLTKEFFENQDKVTPEERAQYAGLHIAWSWDGARVVASAPSREELLQGLVAAGLDLDRVAWDYVPPLDTTSP